MDNLLFMIGFFGTFYLVIRWKLRREKREWAEAIERNKNKPKTPSIDDICNNINKSIDRMEAIRYEINQDEYVWTSKLRQSQRRFRKRK